MRLVCDVLNCMCLALVISYPITLDTSVSWCRPCLCLDMSLSWSIRGIACILERVRMLYLQGQETLCKCPSPSTHLFNFAANSPWISTLLSCPVTVCLVDIVDLLT